MALVLDPPPVAPAQLVPLVLIEAGGPPWSFAPLPDPDDGDPDAPLIPAEPRRLGRDVRMLLKRPGATRPLSELRTLSDPVLTDRLDVAGSVFRAVVSGADPGWDAVGEPGLPVIVRGTEAPVLDPQRIDAEVVVDGQREFCGTFAGAPRTVEGDWRQIDLVDGLGVAAQMDVRTSWGDDNIDLLEGAGSFDGPSPLAGWTITGDLDYSVGVPSTFGPYIGRCMRIHTGSQRGTIFSPWRWTAAEPGVAGWESSAQVHLTEQFGDQSVSIRTEVVEVVDGPFPWPQVGFDARTGSVSGPGGVWGHPWTGADALRWTMWSTAPEGLLLARVVIDVDAKGSAVGIDEVRIRRSGMTSLWTDDGTDRDPDYSYQVVEALRASVLRDPSAGWVIAATPVEYATPGVFWWDDSGTRGSEAISQITSRPNGPEVWCDGDWTIRVGPRRGRDRTDLILDDFCCPDASWDRLVPVDALTQWTHDGIGHRWVRSTPEGKRRVEQMIFDRGEDADGRTLQMWAEIRERQAALPPYAGTSVLPMRYGQVVAGDGVRVAHRRGRDAVAGAFRASEVERRYAQEVQAVSWGSDVAVTGAAWGLAS
jgi:hypothetical protein